MRHATRSISIPSCLKAVILCFSALAISAIPAIPAFAADAQPSMMAKMKEVMCQHPEVMKEMMANPDHILAMAYRHNLLTFGKALEKVAREGETVPPEVARKAVGEMMNSRDQLERLNDKALQSLTEDKKAMLDDMPKMMNEHLTDIKASLARLNEVVKADTIPSKELIAGVDPILRKCEMGMKGMPGDKMMEKMKSRDAELLALVDRMNKAPEEKKVALMADILSRLVKQRAGMNARMEKMHPHGEEYLQLECMPPHRMEMKNDGEEMEMDESDGME